MRKSAATLLCSLLLLAGCVTTPPGSDGATFVLVRHAEKAADDPRDPSLTPTGEARAQRLARSLKGEDVRAVYATPFLRSQSTAAPTARTHGLEVITYDAATPPSDFAARLRREHPTGTVLVVGHSNTIPSVAQALCNCTIGPTAENEYGRRIVVHARPDGRVTADDRREP